MTVTFLMASPSGWHYWHISFWVLRRWHINMLFPGVSFIPYLLAYFGLAHLSTLVVNEARVPSDLFKLEPLPPSAGWTKWPRIVTSQSTATSIHPTTLTWADTLGIKTPGGNTKVTSPTTGTLQRPSATTSGPSSSPSYPKSTPNSLRGSGRPTPKMWRCRWTPSETPRCSAPSARGPSW